VKRVRLVVIAALLSLYADNTPIQLCGCYTTANTPPNAQPGMDRPTS
jgi:hypothetical protein